MYDTSDRKGGQITYVWCHTYNRLLTFQCWEWARTTDIIYPQSQPYETVEAAIKDFPLACPEWLNDWEWMVISWGIRLGTEGLSKLTTIKHAQTASLWLRGYCYVATLISTVKWHEPFCLDSSDQMFVTCCRMTGKLKREFQIKNFSLAVVVLEHKISRH